MTPLASSSTSPASAPPLAGRRIAFTTPPSYSRRLAELLRLRGAAPLPTPSVITNPTPQNLSPFLSNSLDSFSALAFPSRTAISAFSAAISSPPLSAAGPLFTVAALGSDADLINDLDLLRRLNPSGDRVILLVPDVATPAALAAALGEGGGRKVLCPVPEVIDLEEPPVVPNFLKDLQEGGWIPVRVPAYTTKWAGRNCMEALVNFEGKVDALIFTSTAEVEGMLKGLEILGFDWRRLRDRWPEMVVAAHGPVTAKGAERWGAAVDVVGVEFGSFNGVLDALHSWWSTSSH